MGIKPGPQRFEHYVRASEVVNMTCFPKSIIMLLEICLKLQMGEAGSRVQKPVGSVLGRFKSQFQLLGSNADMIPYIFLF